MNVRMANENDYMQLAELKWLHCKEDEFIYGEQSLKDCNKKEFMEEFVDFLKYDNSYKIFVIEDNGIILSSMFLHMIRKLPRPNGKTKFIGYITNVFTKEEYRNKGIGTKLLNHIKDYAINEKCELLFVFPSNKSIKWYEKNGFNKENDIFELIINEE